MSGRGCCVSSHGVLKGVEYLCFGILRHYCDWHMRFPDTVQFLEIYLVCHRLFTIWKNPWVDPWDWPKLRRMSGTQPGSLDQGTSSNRIPTWKRGRIPSMWHAQVVKVVKVGQESYLWVGLEPLMTLLLWSGINQKLGKTGQAVVSPCPWRHITFMYVLLWGHMLSFFLGIFT